VVEGLKHESLELRLAERSEVEGVLVRQSGPLLLLQARDRLLHRADGPRHRVPFRRQDHAEPVALVDPLRLRRLRARSDRREDERREQGGESAFYTGFVAEHRSLPLPRCRKKDSSFSRWRSSRMRWSSSPRVRPPSRSGRTTIRRSASSPSFRLRPLKAPPRAPSRTTS